MGLMQENPRLGDFAAEINLHAAIALIYQSSANGGSWRDVASSMARVFDVDAVVLCHTEGNSVRVLGEGLYNVSPEDAARLPLSYSATTLPAGAHHSGSGAVRTVDDAGFARDIDRLPPGARVLTVVIPEIDHTEARPAPHLSVAGANGRLPFSTRQQDLRLLFSQHLTEAVRIQRRFARLQRTANFHGKAVLHLGEAWLVIDRTLDLVDCNPLARAFLLRSDILQLRGGRVAYPHEGIATQIEEAVAPVWSGELEHAQVSVTSPGDGSQVGLDFLPVYLGERRSDDAPDGLMVLVREVDQELKLKIEAKAEACRLSRAERKVMLRLVRSGQPPATIATALGVSERTVRCQLSSIFRKTGARNQQDLIRMTLAG